MLGSHILVSCVYLAEKKKFQALMLSAISAVMLKIRCINLDLQLNSILSKIDIKTCHC